MSNGMAAAAPRALAAQHLLIQRTLGIALLILALALVLTPAAHPGLALTAPCPEAVQHESVAALHRDEADLIEACETVAHLSVLSVELTDALDWRERADGASRALAESGSTDALASAVPTTLAQLRDETRAAQVNLAPAAAPALSWNPPVPEPPLAWAAPVPELEPTPVPVASNARGGQAEFIQTAAQAARESQRATGVPASVTIAQAILESDWGLSQLSQQGQNYFGIKAQSLPGSAGVVWFNTWEVLNGRNVVQHEPFRAYASASDSFVDHGLFFIQNARYAAALAVRNDPREFARRINQAGYATDPNYAAKLIGLMDRFNLYAYDLP
jgi:flagellum-specific peptidoglycan hydrolase FlgJ